MDKLIALPIKGESFLLLRAGKSVLVDGGYNSRDLSRALKAHAPDLKKIDIVVCTHADRDHAGGLASLISTSGLSVGEFWLPGTWGDSIPELINDPETTVSGLLSELDRIPTGWPKEPQMDHEAVAHHFEKNAAEERRAAYSERFVRNFSRDDAPQPVDPLWNPLHQEGKSLDWSDSLPLSYSERRLFTRSGRAFEKGRRKIRDRKRNGKVSPEVASYWLELIDAAQAIRAIAVQALAFGVKVRWFDYSAFAKYRRASGGDAGFLEPLNAIEMPPPLPRVLSCLARLSPANEECLAFFAPPDYSRFGVVFCGDSPLGDGPNYTHSFLANRKPNPFLPFVVTAPHHGSEHNRIAYGHIQSWGHASLWVRSGGSIKQPGPTFKAIAPVRRACTHCPQKDLPLREAVIHLARRSPCFRVSSHECDCVDVP